MTRASETFTFDWQAEPEGFLRWLLAHVLAEVHENSVADYEHIATLTGDWRHVTLGVTVNGVAVPTGDFVRGVEALIRREAERAAQLWVFEHAEIMKFNRAVARTYEAVREKLVELAREAGLEVDDEENVE